MISCGRRADAHHFISNDHRLLDSWCPCSPVLDGSLVWLDFWPLPHHDATCGYHSRPDMLLAHVARRGLPAKKLELEPRRPLPSPSARFDVKQHWHRTFVRQSTYMYLTVHTTQHCCAQYEKLGSRNLREAAGVLCVHVQHLDDGWMEELVEEGQTHRSRAAPAYPPRPSARPSCRGAVADGGREGGWDGQ
ncbi:hypothetical protein BKA80DRAFT_279678 [Phyllosticta citrichinensis]